MARLAHRAHAHTLLCTFAVGRPVGNYRGSWLYLPGPRSSLWLSHRMRRYWELARGESPVFRGLSGGGFRGWGGKVGLYAFL